MSPKGSQKSISDLRITSLLCASLNASPFFFQVKYKNKSLIFKTSLRQLCGIALPQLQEWEPLPILDHRYNNQVFVLTRQILLYVRISIVISTKAFHGLSKQQNFQSTKSISGKTAHMLRSLRQRQQQRQQDREKEQHHLLLLIKIMIFSPQAIRKMICYTILNPPHDY